jgi:competence protein ComEC
MTFRPRVTRFRAYQLDTPGSSFSYFANGHFRLIEARLTDHSKASVEAEMVACCVDRAHALDITSWDQDHCNAAELPALLRMILPQRIETPGYNPHSDNGWEALRIIRDYKASQNREVVLREITPTYIAGLPEASAAAFNPIYYHPRYIDENCSNNNSTVKLYREGSFNLLSLGDVECPQISARLRRDKFLTRETDVMILAHHGADNGFTTKTFLERLEPHLAICTADYDNKHDHPREEIRELLHEQGIRLMTTKTGDVLLKSIGDHTGNYRAINFKARSTEVSSTADFRSKKAKLLSYNDDTIRQLYAARPHHRRLI